MDQNRTVSSLQAMAVDNIVLQCWRSSKAVKIMAKYYADVIHKRDSGKFHGNQIRLYDPSDYTDDIINIVTQILELEIPAHLKIDIGNCFIEFDKHAISFLDFIFDRTLPGTPKEFMEYCGKSVVMSPTKIINSKQTIINIVLGPFSWTKYLHPNFVLDYCVELSFVNFRQNNFDTCPSFFVDSLFPDVELCWEHRRQRHRPDLSPFIFCATTGSVEAMEYFFPKLEDAEKEEQLCRAAMMLIKKQDMTLIKLLFFYKHMRPATWNLLVTNNFYVVMMLFISSYRYGRFAVHIYNNLKNRISADSIRKVLESITEYYAINSRSGNDTTLKQLIFNEIELIFYLIWHVLPSRIKHNMTWYVRMFINKFLLRNRFNIVASLIELKTFNKKQQCQLVYHVVKTLIVTKKKSRIDEFLAKLSKKPHFNPERIKADYLNLGSFIQFIIFGDSCQNISKYDSLLRTKFSPDLIRQLKSRLLFDVSVLHMAAGAIKYRELFSVKSFYDLFCWCCMDRPVSSLLPQFHDVQLYTFKMHLYYRQSSVMLQNPFFLKHDSMMKKIKKELMNDLHPLTEYCFGLITRRDFSELPNILAWVFETEKDKVKFIDVFFRSHRGYDALSSLITDVMFDVRIHQECDFGKKISDYIAFKKHWVLSTNIIETIEFKLRLYEVPPVYSDKNKKKKLCLLPNENMDDYVNGCLQNLQIVRNLLRLSEEEFLRYVYSEDL